jgi:hypothetical protein
VGRSLSRDAFTSPSRQRTDCRDLAPVAGQRGNTQAPTVKFRTDAASGPYSLKPPGPRQNRISFYVFNPAGNRGCGSYFQDRLRAGEWIEVVGVADALNKTTAIYKNGNLRHTDSYVTLTPASGSALLRFGTREFSSFFKGAIGPVLIWDRPLAAREVKALHASSVVPTNGLVAQFPNDEGSGTAIHDSVGGKVGEIHRAAWQTGKGPVGITTGSSGGGC